MEGLSCCRRLDGVLRIGEPTSRGDEVFDAMVVVTAEAAGGVHNPAAEAAAAN